jgi:formylglycine-generating enzyme required for sulfatase activity
MSSLPNEKAAGRMYRLPSEAQWEYACRAGTTTRFCFGDDVSGLDEYGWPEGTWSSSSNITPPVGEKKPNAWGLYDIYANVWQFCADWFDATYYANSPVDDPPGGQLSFYVPPTVDPKGGQSGLRICRGGGWNWPKKFCRSADRNHYGTGHQEYYLGFRASLVFADNSEDQAKVTRGADAAQPADQTGN